ncbi:VOC family protein [Caulobacter segnis]|uniref:VOC family protein n=1 Tax=Caulobacter segnis TaxID=88688 RepID=UPI001CBADCAC|nr:VOC family protein [Caulobacter segnis]UAL11919.1 VOC family protein [Caulobacter segnis]
MTASISNIRFGRLAASAFTRDIQASCAFYRDVLGFEKTFQNGDPVGFMILEKDAAELHLSLVRDHKSSTTNIAHLLVDDVDALHDRLVAAGVRIIKSLADKDYGLRAFVFADLDGNRIDVGQPLTPAEPMRFENRDMAGAIFDDVNLANANFGNANLSGARLTNVNLSGVSIDDAKIDGLTIFGMDIQTLIRAELARRRAD